MGRKTLEDIAKDLDVSIATVSRALNSKTEQLVKNETRNRVIKYVRKTGYKPNLKARGLARGKLTNFFLVLSQDEDSIFYDQYFLKIIRGILTGIVDTEYSLVILPIGNDYTEDQIYDILLNNETAGLILSPYCSQLDFPYDAVRGYKFPVISLDHQMKGEHIYNIQLNHKDAGYAGAQFLWDKGYRKILLVSDDQEYLHSKYRKQGFYRFFEDKDKGTFKLKEIKKPLSYVSAVSVIEEIKKDNEFPVGVFALSDEIATGMLGQLKYHGLDCPDQVGVLGFDALSIGRYVYPRLSSVGFSFFSVGKTVADILIKSLAGEKIPAEHRMRPIITDGQSC